MNKETQDKIAKSLLYSIIDGSFYCVMVGFGESLFSAFGVFLKATNFQLGLLGSLPQVLGSFSQLFTHKLVALFRSRQRFVCYGAFSQALMYIPILYVVFLGNFKTWYLVLFISLYFISGMILGPAWNSWMGDLVEENRRGSYFGMRNRIVGTAAFVATLIAGHILEIFNDKGEEYLGFCILFIFAFLARTVSSIFLSIKYEPEYKTLPEDNLGFVEFLKNLHFNNYTVFVLFLCFMNFAVFVSAPFFTPYILKDLNADYTEFTIVMATMTITKLIVMPSWGKACDRFGTKKILTLTSFLMPLVPLFWLYPGHLWYMISIQVYGGLVWAGYEISIFNYMFETTTASQRVTYVAYYNVMNGVSMFLGSIVGSIAVKYCPIGGFQYMIVFLVSGVLRGLASFTLVPKLSELRTVEPISYPKLLLKVVTSMPTIGLMHQIITFRKKNGNGKKSAL